MIAQIANGGSVIEGVRWWRVIVADLLQMQTVTSDIPFPADGTGSDEMPDGPFIVGYIENDNGEKHGNFVAMSSYISKRYNKPTNLFLYTIGSFVVEYGYDDIPAPLPEIDCKMTPFLVNEIDMIDLAANVPAAEVIGGIGQMSFKRVCAVFTNSGANPADVDIATSNNGLTSPLPTPQKVTVNAGDVGACWFVDLSPQTGLVLNSVLGTSGSLIVFGYLQ